MQPVKLLWTGGWDSTFRLMMLLLVHQRNVQTYYLIDETRESLAFEIQAMARIKEHLRERWPHARQLLLPTVYGARRDLLPDPSIKRSYENLYARSRLGGQYDWLARFAAQRGLCELEIGITDSEDPNDTANVFLKSNIERADTPDIGPIYALKEDLRDTDLGAVFGRYSFPLLYTSKPEMGKLAESQGFGDVLKMTWFCHSPRPDGRPCGICHPCVTTRERGMHHRVPKPVLSYRIRRVLAPWVPQWLKEPVKRRMGWD